MNYVNPFDNNDISSYTVNSFGESVRQRREELDISVRKMAERLGMSAMYLSDIERGKRPAPSGNISGKDCALKFFLNAIQKEMSNEKWEKLYQLIFD